MSRLTGTQVAEAGLDGWTNVARGLQTRIPTGDFATGLALVNRIGAAAEEANHHPEINFRYGHIDVRLSSHDAGGVTERDVTLARTITALAAESGLHTAIDGVSRVEWALDSPDFSKVHRFWAAVLGMSPGPDEDDLADEADVLPAVWFQRSGSEEPRQHWHPDLWVDPSEVPSRIAAALAEGGTLDSDAEAPRFWVLAAPEGNKVCLCTWQDRA